MKVRLSIPLQLVGVIAFVVLCGGWVPLFFTQLFYTFSVLFKEFLSATLPFMVFFFVITGILSFRKNAPLVLGVLLATVFCSNAFVAFLSYLFMSCTRPLISCQTSTSLLPPTAMAVEPLLSLSVPLPINGVQALIAAIVIGLFLSVVRLAGVERIIGQCKNGIERLMNVLFIPLLPLYILGFLLKIRAEGTFGCLMQQYSTAFFSIIALQISYLLWFYFLAARFSITGAWCAIKNALPSYIAAFSTMSSTAAIPVSVKAAEENTGNRELANMAMPIMANVHLLGDSIITPILAMVTMLTFTGLLPTVRQYIAFVFYFCMSMFAVSGIPGGGVLVMVPILKSELGFSSEMVSIVMTMYFLLDSFGTGANVMGDGALVMIVNRIIKRLGIA